MADEDKGFFGKVTDAAHAPSRPEAERMAARSGHEVKSSGDLFKEALTNNPVTDAIRGLVQSPGEYKMGRNAAERNTGVDTEVEKNAAKAEAAVEAEYANAGKQPQPTPAPQPENSGAAKKDTSPSSSAPETMEQMAGRLFPGKSWNAVDFHLGQILEDNGIEYKKNSAKEHDLKAALLYSMQAGAQSEGHELGAALKNLEKQTAAHVKGDNVAMRASKLVGLGAFSFGAAAAGAVFWQDKEKHGWFHACTIGVAKACVAGPVAAVVGAGAGLASMAVGNVAVKAVKKIFPTTGGKLEEFLDERKGGGQHSQLRNALEEAAEYGREHAEVANSVRAKEASPEQGKGPEGPNNRGGDGPEGKNGPTVTDPQPGAAAASTQQDALWAAAVAAAANAGTFVERQAAFNMMVQAIEMLDKNKAMVDTAVEKLEKASGDVQERSQATETEKTAEATVIEKLEAKVADLTAQLEKLTGAVEKIGQNGAQHQEPANQNRTMEDAVNQAMQGLREKGQLFSSAGEGGKSGTYVGDDIGALLDNIGAAAAEEVGSVTAPAGNANQGQDSNRSQAKGGRGRNAISLN